MVEYRRSASDPLVADPQSAREVLGVDQPYPNHNGGLLLFGPGEAPKGSQAADLLYIGLGDGGSEDDPDRNGQDLSTLLGKILRIDPRASGERPYSVPDSNPFVGRSGARPEIYSYGLRNPWRFSFDPATGALAIADVGQNEIEEVNLVARGKGRGANFGWSAYEGFDRFNDDQQAPGRACRRFSSTATTPAARSPAATWHATAGCRRSTAATCTGTSAPGSCAASRPRPAAAPPTTARSGSRSRR